MGSFFTELRRRNVFRVSAMYVVVCWITMQVIAVMTPALHLPDWVDSFLAVMFIAGFPISMLIAWAFEITPDGIVPTETVDKAASIRAETGRKLDISLLFGLLAVAALIIFDRVIPEKTALVENTPQSTSEQNLSANGLTTIAVLPFKDISPNQDQQYFSDGIAEEILNLLVKVDGMQVLARTSSFAYRSEEQDAAHIRRQLNVTHYLEGSVRKDSDNLRIKVSLIDAATGVQKWGDTYPGTLDNIFELQEDIATSVTDQLKVVLDVQSNPRLTQNTQSYDLFLQSRALFRSSFSGEGIDKAITLMQRTVELDPDFAEAWALLGQAYLSAPALVSSLDAEEYLQKAVVASETARKLDSSLAYPYATLASVKTINGDPLGAMELLVKAEERDPLDSFVLTNIGMLNALMGNMDEGEHYVRRAVKIDPSRASFLSYLSQIQRAAGKYQSSDESCNKAADMGYFICYDILAFNAYARGDIQSATENLLKLQELGADQLAPDFRARSLWESGARAYFQESVSDLEALRAIFKVYLQSEDAEVNGLIVTILSRIDLIDLYFDNVDKALSGSAFSLVGIWEDTKPSKAIRRHERFFEFAEKRGMIKYWQTHGWPDLCQPLTTADGQTVTGLKCS